MYLREFRLNWQTLLGCSVGMALGSAISHYTMSILGPAMMREFAWTKAQFALIGSITLLTMPLIPVAGRFTDRFGPRTAAIVGFTAVPLGFLAYTLMTGSIFQFFAIYLVQHVFGVLTTSMVFCRVIVERYDAARGIALSVLMTGPPLVGAITAPLLGHLIQIEGWRVGYIALACLSGVGGVIAVSLMGNRKLKQDEDLPPGYAVTFSLRKFLSILREPAFMLILGGMILVNLPQVFASSQLKLVMLDNAVSSYTATWLVSLYAIGVVIGRFICGLALDRIPTNIVAVSALGLPAIGFLILASPISALPLLAGAVLIIGLAQGAEGDVGAFLVSRQFDMQHYSLRLSTLTAGIGIGSAIGSLFLSFTLHHIGSYTPFLILSATATLIGAFMFYLCGNRPAARLLEGDQDA